MQLTSKRRIAAASVAGLLSIAALLTAPFAGGASASQAEPDSTLPIYALRGKAGGIDVELALRPSIFDPLMQAAIAYATSATDSSAGGASSAIASEFYPGSLISGGAGCGGVPGTVSAGYPQTTCHHSSQEGTGLDYPSSGQGPLVLKAGHMKTDTGLGRALGTVTMGRIKIEPVAGVALTIQGMTSTSQSARGVSGIEQITITTINGLTLETSALRLDIDQMVSTARTTSDGNTGTADGTMRFTGATATFSGQSHAVTIDNDGIHLTKLNGPTPPPQAPLPDDVRQPLETRLQEAIGQAGLEIRSGKPVKIVEANHAEAAVGGLVIVIETGRPPYPPIPPPPVPLPQPSNQCLGTGPLKGLCVGPGLIPIPPGDIAPTISIGAVEASAVADHGYQFGLVPPVRFPQQPPGGTVVGGVTYTPPLPTFRIPPQAVQPPATRPQLVGLVSRLPASALAVAGIILLVLAVGLAAGPSLRRT